MGQDGQTPVPIQPRVLDDPAGFGAVMGSAATASVAALHPGQIAGLDGFAGTTAIVLLMAYIAAFMFLWSATS